MTIRQPTDADWPAVKAFAEKHFGFSHVPLQDFNEHWFKPPCHPGWAALAVDDGAGGPLAGLMMFIVAPAWFDGQATRMAFISSTATEPEARARGAGLQLYLNAYRAFPLVGAQSGNQFSSPINAKLGNKIAVGMRRFLRLLDPAVADLCRAEGRGPVLGALARQAGLPTPSGLESRWLDVPAEGYDDLWRQFRDRFAVTIDRTAEYLRHRYVQAPILRYRFLELRRGGTLVGQAVVRMQFTPVGDFARITDFAVRPGCEAEAMGSTIAAIARERAIACDFLVVGTGLDRDLAQGGMELADPDGDLGSVPNLLAPVDHRRWTCDFYLGGAATRQSEAWRDSDRLYFTKGDSDRDWPTGYDVQRLGLG